MVLTAEMTLPTMISTGPIAAFNAVCAANPYVLIIAAIVALVAAFIYLWNNCEEFRQFWIDLWESIKEIAVAVWEALKEFFTAAWEAIKTTAVTVWNAIKDFFTVLWEGIKNIFTTVVNAISTFLTNAWNAIKNTVTTVFNAIDKNLFHYDLERDQIGYHNSGDGDIHLPEYGMEWYQDRNHNGTECNQVRGNYGLERH